MKIREIAEKIAICAYCPFMCKDICTVYAQTKRDSLSPTMHEYLLWMVLEGKISYRRDVGEILYESCSGCLLCQSWCASRQDVPEKLRLARMDLVELNLTPQSVQRVEQSTLSHHNPYHEPHEKRLSLLALKPSSKKGGSILYFVGCTAAYRRPELASAALRLMERCGEPPRVLDDEWCCGLPQYELGLMKTVERLAQHNREVIVNQGVEAVVTSCPECYYMLSQVYPRLGYALNIPVHHISQYLNMLMEERRLKLGRKLKPLTYHDPCYLGRRSQVYEEPRLVLKHVSEDLRELRWSRDKAYCGGGGVAYSLTYPGKAYQIGIFRLPMGESHQGVTLVTAC
ncbi:MAG: (Fe-S)-binding protein, partial [Candidatus Bathyarchaeia archaeon]